MRAVNILDARNNLSRLVNAVGAGEEIVIANRGKPVARIVPAEPASSKSGANIAAWLVKNPLPTKTTRTRVQLEEQIRDNLEAWD